MTPKIQRAIALALRLLLGGVFLYAAVSKLPDLRAFAEEIADYRLLPASLVPLAASALPGIELALGSFLVIGAWTRAAALLAGGLLALFTSALAQALARGIDLRCGCFGGAELASWATVGRDALLLACSAALIWLAGDRGAQRADSRLP